MKDNWVGRDGAREWKIRACSTCTVENDNGFMKITFLRSCNTNRLDNFPMYCITDQMKAVCKICICMKRLVLHVIPKNQKCYIYFISYKRREQEKLHLPGENKANCNFLGCITRVSLPTCSFPLESKFDSIEITKKNIGVFRYLLPSVRLQIPSIHTNF